MGSLVPGSCFCHAAVMPIKKKDKSYMMQHSVACIKCLPLPSRITHSRAAYPQNADVMGPASHLGSDVELSDAELLLAASDAGSVVDFNCDDDDLADAELLLAASDTGSVGEPSDAELLLDAWHDADDADLVLAATCAEAEETRGRQRKRKAIAYPSGRDHVPPSLRPLSARQLDLLDHIADETSMYKWPDKLVEMFFSPHLRQQPRWAMGSFLWWNRISHAQSEEWFTLLGAFADPRNGPKRKREFREVFEKLDSIVRHFGDNVRYHQKMQQWRVFDVERGDYVRMSTRGGEDCDNDYDAYGSARAENHACKRKRPNGAD